jgi:hypothetical protein
MLHDYHFILNEESYLKLNKISAYMKNSLSKTIVVLFEKLVPYIEKKHLFSSEKNSSYMTIADKDEKRIHLHSYFPEHRFRKIKQIHNDLNYYSMAQIFRKLIDYFISGCMKYGVNEFIKMLENIKDKWENKKKFYKKEKVTFRKQLSYNPNNFPYMLITYDNNSCPIVMRFT